MALERPPHLTAIWPDVVPTNSFQHQSREGGAMQLHMFWALFIHAQDAQDIADDPEKQADVWGDLTRLRELFWETPYREGQTSLRHVPTLEKCLLDYYTRGSYDELWSRKEYDYTAYWDEHADIPGTYSTGWYDAFPHADSEYFAAMAAKNSTPQRLVVGPWSHVGMRGDATYTLDVDFGPDAAWGVQRYFAEQLAFFDRWLKEDGGAPEDEAPVRIFVMGGGSGRKTALGKLDHGGRWREEHEWPLARAVRGDLLPAAAPARLSLEPPSRKAGGGAAPLHLRPGASGADDRRPLLLGRRAARPRAQGWSRRGRASSARCCGCATSSRPARPTRRRRRSSSPPASRIRGCRSAPTCSSTRPSRSRSPSR